MFGLTMLKPASETARATKPLATPSKTFSVCATRNHSATDAATAASQPIRISQPLVGRMARSGVDLFSGHESFRLGTLIAG
jgi:hypothetical protein